MTAKILIIDDEKDLLVTLDKYLTLKKYSITTRDNGKDGVEEAGKNKYALIIVDIRMPGMNGIEAIGHIRKIDKGVVVIILTGYPDMDTALKGYYLNIFDYMTKPFSLEKVRAVIVKALPKHSKADG